MRHEVIIVAADKCRAKMQRKQTIIPRLQDLPFKETRLLPLSPLRGSKHVERQMLSPSGKTGWVASLGLAVQ
jgi:hypothetical protein